MNKGYVITPNNSNIGYVYSPQGKCKEDNIKWLDENIKKENKKNKKSKGVER